MKFAHAVPNLKIFVDNECLTEIQTVKSFKETEDKVIIKCAEYPEIFKRGIVCDISYSYLLRDSETGRDEKSNCETIHNLVLVYVNKSVDCEETVLDTEYVFYK